MDVDGALATARLARMERLNAHNTFCWAQLAIGAMGLNTSPGWLREARSMVEECRQSAEGLRRMCYCGQFREERGRHA